MLLQLYHRDRRKLLEFIMSSSLVKDVRLPPGATGLNDVDWDTVSVDHVIECAKEGRLLDLSESSKRYYLEEKFPLMVNSESRSSFYLLSDPEYSGSPPRHVPPQVGANFSWQSSPVNPLVDDVITKYEVEDGGIPITSRVRPSQPMNGIEHISFGLPSLSTGLSDDDLRDASYEVLVACTDVSRDMILSSEGKKKDRRTKFLSKLRTKKEKLQPQNCFAGSDFELLDTIRMQLEISEAMDRCIRQSLIHTSSASRGPISIAVISLELLSNISKSSFSNEKAYINWLKRQANILEELLAPPTNRNLETDLTMLKNLLSKIKHTTDWALMTPSKQGEVLTSIRRFASELAQRPGKFRIPGETYFWTGAYHLNIRLYEKLLNSVFDILEEGKLLEEVDEILEFLRATWPTLGITPQIHDALYAWVLFQQFVLTGESMLLEQATLQMHKVPMDKDCAAHEREYVDGLTCAIEVSHSRRNLSLIHAVLMSINLWCENRLTDYHLYFSEDSSNFEVVVNSAVVIKRLVSLECGENKSSLQVVNQSVTERELVSEQIKNYITRSIQAAYLRVVNALDTKGAAEGKPPLALLADEIKFIVERERTVFTPVLCHWCPDARVSSILLLHRLYGQRLRPFLEGVSQLSKDARSVLPAADALDHYLMDLVHSAHGKEMVNTSSGKDLHSYQVGEISGPLILSWVDSQHDKMLEWIERSCHLEDWEPLSSQQRQAASIVEVFRIIEETVDQFFGFKLPLETAHLKSLLGGIVRGLATYLQQVISHLVEKNHLFPPAPALTRYKEPTMKPFNKKKVIECKFLEEEVEDQLNVLATSKICVRLNTLQYIGVQVNALEDAMQKCWACIRPGCTLKSSKLNHQGDSKDGSFACTDDVDELFATFDSIRETTNALTEKICDFIGPKVVFWDMRETFINYLYQGSVSSARMENVLQQLDTVLNNVCDLIVDPLRDSVVLSIFRASLNGYVWVLLDGGPSRAFSPSDFEMMLEDLKLLKEFFVANGEGLPPAVVEREARLAHQILDLYNLQTETIIKRLMLASEQISSSVYNRRQGARSTEDVDTLLRVLCHKSDKQASKFLKRQFGLPKSSDYEVEHVGNESMSPFKSPVISELLKRSASIQWGENSQKSWSMIKKKLMEATSDIKQGGW
ncbi:uncharacterized protein LOC18447695 isoform X3 [Amborella trichopoda]|uniref:uncharacterized protein LOC18447695 isoform X3 n=1 Tax=Amborella trichopoda TaxID=13333 RepID=UPI0009BD29D3|nr:uncharacterized protein LOC18447695 isoform X3 [Amborella trichopoda]|eukprot:XP_020531363.1 uncharacterized protein LOC18447695 isoform X3 [Amborella trichopoda]